MTLPFLKKRSLPILRKFSGESRYGFSEDEELIEKALDELLDAYTQKNHSKLVEALNALINCIIAKEDEHATDSLEDAESV